jgi:hypothetical protein
MRSCSQRPEGRLHGRVDAGWSSPVARRAHNPKVAGSNPAPATTNLINRHRTMVYARTLLSGCLPSRRCGVKPPDRQGAAEAVRVGAAARRRAAAADETSIGEVVAAFIEHMRAHRPERPRGVRLVPDQPSGGALPRVQGPGGRRRKCWPITASCFEEITTTAVSDFLVAQVQVKGSCPRLPTAIARYWRMGNWTMGVGAGEEAAGPEPGRAREAVPGAGAGDSKHWEPASPRH